MLILSLFKKYILRLINYKFDEISSLQAFQIIKYSVLILVSIVFAKLQLPNESIGHYEAFMLLSGIVSFFWINGIIQSLLSIYNIKSINTENKNPIFFNTFLTVTAINLISILILLFFKKEFIYFFLNNNSFEMYALLPIYIFFNTPTLLIEYIFLLKNKNKKLLVYGLVTFVLQFVLIILPIALNYTILYGMYGLIIISIIRYVWLFIILYKYSCFKLDFDIILKIINLAYPLAISSLIGGSAQYIDGLIVSYKYNSEVFAIFRYGAKELPFALLLANALSYAMINQFTKDDINNSLNKLKKKSKELMHILFPISIALLVSSNYIFPLIFNSSFTKSSGVFNIFLFLVISRLIFPQTILLGLRRNKIILFAAFTELIINVVLSFVLIKYYGINGIALATVIAYFYEKTFLTIYNYKILKINPKSYIAFKPLIIYSVIMIVIFFIFTYSTV